MNELKTSYTSAEIFALMVKGAGIALMLLTAVIGFMIVVWVIGGFLPEEARSAVSSAAPFLPVVPAFA